MQIVPLFADNSSLLASAGILIIAIVMVRFFFKPKRGATNYSSPLSKENSDANMLDAPQDIGRWEVQMHDTARHLMGELNSKIVVVEQLVRDANAAAERLEKALDRSQKP